MKQELLHFFSVFVAIFVVIDPFAMVPVYLTLTNRFSPEGVRHTRRKAIFVATGILVVFGLSGLSVFRLFGITLPAFQIAGGILMLLFGIAQLNNTRTRVKPEETDESLERDDISVFPLGTPLLAGPGAISTVVLLSTQAKTTLRTFLLALAIVLAMYISYLVLKSAGYLFKILGRTGLNLLTRIMGLILTAIAIQFMLNGIKGALQSMGVNLGPVAAQTQTLEPTPPASTDLMAPTSAELATLQGASALPKYFDDERAAPKPQPSLNVSKVSPPHLSPLTKKANASRQAH